MPRTYVRAGGVLFPIPDLEASVEIYLQLKPYLPYLVNLAPGWKRH